MILEFLVGLGFLGCKKSSKPLHQVIQSDLFIPDRWRSLNLWKGHVFTIPKRSPAELLGIHPWNEINSIPAIWIQNHVQNLCPDTWNPASAARYQISQGRGATTLLFDGGVNSIECYLLGSQVRLYKTLNFRDKNTFETSRLMQAFSHLKGFQSSMIASQNSLHINGTNPCAHHPLSGLKHRRCWHSFRQHLRYEACLAAIDATSTCHAHTSILTVQNRQTLEGMVQLQEDQFGQSVFGCHHFKTKLKKVWDSTKRLVPF